MKAVYSIDPRRILSQVGVYLPNVLFWYSFQEMHSIFLTFIEVWTQWVLCKVSDAWKALRLLCARPTAFILRWMSEKWNSSIIFTLCLYIVFVHYLLSFDLNLVNKRGMKSYKPTYLVIMFNSHLHDMMSIAFHLSIHYFIYPWRCLRVTSHEQVSFIGVWTLSVQNRFI